MFFRLTSVYGGDTEMYNLEVIEGSASSSWLMTIAECDILIDMLTEARDMAIADVIERCYTN